MAAAQTLALDDLVEPPSVFVKDGRPVTFACWGLVEFKTLDDLFAYVDREAGRWSFRPTPRARRFADGLCGAGWRAGWSRWATKPVEPLPTHTREELDRA